MKILILSFFLLPFSFLFSLGNLQFNQVITLTGQVSTGSANWFDSNTSNVPAGKVWKVESISGAPNSGNDSYRTGVIINGSRGVISNPGNDTAGNGSFSADIFPIWLKSTDNIGFTCYGATNNSTSYSYIISIIEFNIIP